MEKATSIYTGATSTFDDLLVQYGEIQGDILTNFVYQSLVNREYVDEGSPIYGGTIRVRRMAMATSQDYGTARTALAGNSLRNYGVDVQIDTGKEIAEELSLKDKELYMEKGGIALLESRRSSYANTMGITLETAYFTELQNTAASAGLVDVSAISNVEDKLLALIRTLEAVENANVNGVPREMMVLTLAPEWYDELEAYMVTLSNPQSNSTRLLHGVEVINARRQKFDAIVQAKGSIAQPLVMSEEFEVGKWQGSADYYAYLPYYFGTKAVMSDLVFACALDEDISA